MAKLILGCGYVGLRVARHWLQKGEQVYAVTRRAERAAELQALGISPVLGDVTQRLNLPPMAKVDTVLYAIGFDRSTGHTIEEVYVDGFARALDALPADVGPVIYVSSTGVYGHGGGEWVDEDSPCQPQRTGGKAVLAAEQVLAGHALGAQAIVLRLAGIYGPGRVPRLPDVQQGKPLTAAADAFLNLIHVDDAAAAILAAEASAAPPVRYVVSDGCPVRRADFYGELARQLGVAPPEFVAPGDPTPRTQRDLSSKRIRNARMTADLLPSLQYPSYQEGLAHVVQLAGGNR